MDTTSSAAWMAASAIWNTFKVRIAGGCAEIIYESGEYQSAQNKCSRLPVITNNQSPITNHQ
ncbi:MAG TPA: hypothetical protein DGO89_11415 [Microcoleaceae bacterium UBA9251]|nr:hypothetical protein [Microcoleaceae cyanobacterium UBA9251]